MTTTKAKPLRAKTIDHITLVVSDLEQSAKFYTEVLGMEAVERPDFGFPGRWFQAGSTQIHMNVEGEEAGKSGLVFQGATRLTRGFHYAFRVDDCDTAAARLAELRIPIAAGPYSRPDGARQLYIRDPDGHLVEICSPPS
jgi:catechol 2,3-dioxygenase-like lactoylglutathione lyase family enzyme